MQNKACKSLKTRCKSALFSNCHFVFHVCTAGDRGMKPIANKAEAMFDEHFWFDIDGHVLFMVQAVELTARERISCDAGTQTYEKVCGFRRCARLLKKNQQKQTHRFKLRSLLFKGLRCSRSDEISDFGLQPGSGAETCAKSPPRHCRFSCFGRCCVGCCCRFRGKM